MTPVTLRPFADWIRSTDDHAAHRLELLAHAGAILEGAESADASQRGALAARLERWRYQLLHERRRTAPAGERLLAPEDRALLDALDRAVGRLIGAPTREPRWPREALTATPTSDERLKPVEAAFDKAVPLADLMQQAAAVTASRGGERNVAAHGTTPRRRVRLYAPLYLSSQCVNDCTYCGFNFAQPIERRHLSFDEVDAQARILAAHGFRHVLLVAGDFPGRVSTDYLEENLRRLVRAGMSPSVEIAPQSTADYRRLAAAGAVGVTLYMETYDERLYARYHVRGPKAAYDWRLEAIERAAEAGIKQLGIGVLLGLAPPRDDVRALLRHAAYIQSRYPASSIAFSLPRLHEAPPGFQIPHVVDDEMHARLYCALRIAAPAATLVLSTREAATLRNRLVPVCIDQMSAGSSTAPGGYEGSASTHVAAGEQFPISDDRTPAEVAAWLEQAGMVPSWHWQAEKVGDVSRDA